MSRPELTKGGSLPRPSSGCHIPAAVQAWILVVEILPVFPMMPYCKMLMIACGCIFLVAARSEGSVAITSIGNAKVIQDPTPSATIGYSFYVGASDVVVTSLGLWDDGGDGFSNAHQIGLGPLDSYFASVQMPSGTGTPLVGGFRYVDLDSPVVLKGDTFYVISATGFGGSSDGFTSSIAGTVLPESSGGIVLDVSGYLGGFGSLVLVGGTPHIGPNFQYTVVPEPGFMLLGCSALFLSRRRRPSGAR